MTYTRIFNPDRTEPVLNIKYNVLKEFVAKAADAENDEGVPLTPLNEKLIRSGDMLRMTIEKTVSKYDRIHLT